MGQWEESYRYQKQALELDPLSSNTGANLIETARYMRKFEEADRICAKGLELFPNEVDHYVLMVQNCIAKDGDIAEALRILDSAPSGASLDRYVCRLRGSLYYYQRRYEEALAETRNCSETLATPEDSADYWVDLAETYYLLGDSVLSHAYYDTARLYIEALNARGSAIGGFLPPSLGLVYSRLGEKERAIEEARRDTARMSVSDDAYLGTEPLVDLAKTYVRVGELDKALDLIDTLLSIPSGVFVAELKLNPQYDPLRDHPRFQALIEKYEKEHGI
jgi:serine/threonine-protein kinase